MTQRRPITVFKKGTGPGKPGGPKANSHSLKGGIYADLSKRNLDQRSKLAKAMNAMSAELTNAIGADPSPQQRILIDRCVYKLARLTLFEAETLAGNRSNDEHYLAWSNSLRLDLTALGLERKARDAMDLRRYLEIKAQEPASTSREIQAQESEGE